MELTPFAEDAGACRHHARHRYHQRLLVCRLDPGAVPAARVIDLRVARPVERGRVVLLQLPGSRAGSTRTLLARVERVARHREGYWIVRCGLVCRTRYEEMAGAPA